MVCAALVYTTFFRLLCPVCLMPHWPLAVSLGFFEDVFVPAAQLSQPASL